MDFLPLFLDIRDKKCVIVGGGEVAHRKATLLVRAGGQLHVVSEKISAELQQLCEASNAVVTLAAFSADCLQDATLVIAATDDRDVNANVSELAKAAGVLVNVVDQPDLCSFIVPAIVDRSPIVVAVSSGGASPVLTRQLKELNEVMIPGRIAELGDLLRRYRPQVKKTISSFADRARFWEAILDSEIPELVYSGEAGRAEAVLQEKLANNDSSKAIGEVYLVGAGPGDPDLLTLRALRLMHKADVVLYDRLVSPTILQKVRPDAERIHVGKQRANHTVPQSRINEMLVALAKEGKRVLRLKGGDPFIFGRGGEELSELTRHQIPFQVVPGITAASGCAAYAGIPLTHRDHAQSVQFLPGHLKDGTLDLPWDSLIQEQQTLVFYMGLVGLPKICEELIAHGKRADTPAAIIQQGTTDNQKVVTGTLSDLPLLAEQEELQAPTLIIVGNVVTLRDELSWYEEKPH